jgi:hypothetical protein
VPGKGRVVNVRPKLQQHAKHIARTNAWGSARKSATDVD